jgi:hypothetical protein
MMISTLAFVAGFTAGWVTRTTIDSSKPAMVQIVAFALDTVARIKRALAIERERFEDFVAEANDAVAQRRAERVQERAEAQSVEHAA